VILVLQMEYAMTVISVLRDYETEHGAVATVSLTQCDRLVERYARLALNIDLSQTDNRPGMQICGTAF
jgi:hypothetical protein